MQPVDACDATGTRALNERLRVVSVSGDRLRLAADRAAGCASCGMRKGCGTAVLSGLARTEIIDVARPAGMTVEPGDEVVISIPGGRFLAAAGLAYLLPTLAVVLAAVVGAAAGLTDVQVALLCLGALALALLPLLRAERRGRLLAAFRVESVHPAAGLPTCGP